MYTDTYNIKYDYCRGYCMIIEELDAGWKSDWEECVCRGVIEEAVKTYKKHLNWYIRDE